MASKFSRGDTVRYFSNSVKQEVTGTITDVATNGVAYVMVSGEEKRVQSEKLTLVASAPKAEKKAKTTFRYVCNECGTKLHKHYCHNCGGSDSVLLNTGADADLSIVMDM